MKSFFMMFRLLLGAVMAGWVQAGLDVYSTESSKAIFQFPTHDYFQGSTKDYNFTGLAIMAKLESDADGGCVATPLVDVDTIANMAVKAQVNRTVMVMAWHDAKYNCRLHVYAQLWPIAAKFASAIAEAGLARPKTLVIGTLYRYPGVNGNPRYEPYMSKSPGVSDGLPPVDLNVVFLRSGDWDQLDDKMTKSTADKSVTNSTEEAMAVNDVSGSVEVSEPVVKKQAAVEDDDEERMPTKRPNGKDVSDIPVFKFVLVHDSDPWNVIFTSFWYTSTKWIFFGALLGASVMSGKLLFQSVRAGEFVLDLRNIIFLLGLVASVLLMGAFPLRIKTYAYVILEMFSSYLAGMAFYLLLYLWYRIFVANPHPKIKMEMSASYVVKAFPVVVIFGMVVATAVLIFSLVAHHMTFPTHALLSASAAFGYILPLAQFLVAGLFALFAAKFMLKRKDTVLGDAYDLLTRLAILGVVGFCCYAVLAICNLYIVTLTLITPGRLLVYYLFRQLAEVVRIVVVLSVLGVRVMSPVGK
jgi:hypothetical protein